MCKLKSSSHEEAFTKKFFTIQNASKQKSTIKNSVEAVFHACLFMLNVKIVC